MSSSSSHSSSPSNSPNSVSCTDGHPEYDAIIIGAGLSGLYQLHRLRQLGMKVMVLETGTEVGGTWYWNRYPGARFDSETVSYQFSWSQELLDEWDWTETFSPQPHTLKYLNYIADKFDLRRNIQFKSKVVRAQWQEESRSWRTILENGDEFRSTFLITAIGPLSAPTLPRIPGRDQFKGQSHHTYYWPKEPVLFDGKRVAVIGTGATGVQTIQEVAKTAAHLTIFQRTPNWCAPLHNRKISKEEMVEIRKTYPEVFKRCQESFAAFLHTSDPRKTTDVTADEREAFWEELYETPGFGIWMGNFKDVLVDQKANDLMSEFIANKIRQRVSDPLLAEKLTPKNHGFGTRRVPLETKYYEVYNQENVELVDLLDTPIERIIEKGIRTTDKEHEFDMIIYATGFDALTGGFDRIEFQGKNGLKLKDHWAKGLQTWLGLMVPGFPNLVMNLGPHTNLGNAPRSIEYSVEWISNLIKHMQEHNLARVEAPKGGAEEWTAYINYIGSKLLSSNIDSWMTGVNSNVEGKQTRYVARYAGSAGDYRKRCDKVVKDGYVELLLA